jgi:hypothetical protein
MILLKSRPTNRNIIFDSLWNLRKTSAARQRAAIITPTSLHKHIGFNFWWNLKKTPVAWQHAAIIPPTSLHKHIGLNFWWNLWQTPAAWQRAILIPPTSLHKLVLKFRQISERKSRFQHLLHNTGLPKPPVYNPTKTSVSLIELQHTSIQINNIRPLAK